MTEVERYVSELVKYFKYKPLANAASREARKYYAERISPLLSIDGSSEPLFDSSGKLICNGYDRVVIGDYGSYIEFDAINANTDRFVIPEGQEWRLNLKRYPHVKYTWYTLKGSKSNVKLYHQINTVTYADYIIGKYYVSTDEVRTKNNT